MSRYTIERPKLMQGIDDTRFNPRVIISCLITLAIFMIYNIAASVIGVFYIGAEVFADPSVLEGSFDDIMNSLMQLIYSQPFIFNLAFQHGSSYRSGDNRSKGYREEKAKDDRAG